MNSLKNIYIIALMSLKQLLQSKLLYSAFVISLFILLLVYISYQFTFGVPGRVALEVGLGLMSLASNALSLYMGLTLISSEKKNRTLYMILSRPVSRWSYLAGKIKGGATFLLIYLLILTFFISTSLYFLKISISFDYLITLFFMYLEGVLILMMTLCFSLFLTTSLAFIMSVIFLMAGHSLGDLLSISIVRENALLASCLNLFDSIIPNFYRFNLKDHLFYNAFPDTQTIWYNFWYGLIYIVLFYLLSSMIFKKLNLD